MPSLKVCAASAASRTIDASRQPLGHAALAAQTFSDGNRRYELYQYAARQPFWAEVLLTSMALDHQLLSYAVVRDIRCASRPSAA